jgi:hypothetical protein
MIETRPSPGNRTQYDEDYRPPRRHQKASLRRRAGNVAIATGVTLASVGGYAIYKEVGRALNFHLPGIHLPRTGAKPATGKAHVALETYQEVTLKTPVCPDQIDVDAGVKTNSDYQVLGITTGGTNTNSLLPVRFNVCSRDALAASALVKSLGNTVQNVAVSLPANYVPQSAGPDIFSDVMCLGLKSTATTTDIATAENAYNAQLAKGKHPCANNLIQTHGITGMGTPGEASATTLLAFRMATLAGEITPLPQPQYNQWIQDEKGFYTAEVQGLYPNLPATSISYNLPPAILPVQQLISNLQPDLGALHSDYGNMQFVHEGQETGFKVKADSAGGEVLIPVGMSNDELSLLNSIVNPSR